MLGFHDLSASLSRPNFCDREIIQLSFSKCKVDRQQSPTVNWVSFKDCYHCQWQGHTFESDPIWQLEKVKVGLQKGVVNFKLVLLCCFIKTPSRLSLHINYNWVNICKSRTSQHYHVMFGYHFLLLMFCLFVCLFVCVFLFCFVSFFLYCFVLFLIFKGAMVGLWWCYRLELA